MDRRAFLRRSVIGTTGVLYAHQAGWSIQTLKTWLGRWFRAPVPAPPIVVTDADISALLKSIYADFRGLLFPMQTPLLSQFRRAGSPALSGRGVYWDVVTA